MKTVRRTLTAFVLLLSAIGLTAGPASATKPAPDHKVTICHRTHSETNPYVRITVDIASSGYLKAGHHGHNGPVWYAGAKADGVRWGDIIPPYDYKDFHYNGKNWPEGQSIWENECQTPSPTPTTTPTPSPEVTPTPTPTPTSNPTPTPTPSASSSSTPSPSLTPTPSSSLVPPGETDNPEPIPTLPSTDAKTASSPLSDGNNVLAILLTIAFVAVGLSMIPLDRKLDQRRDARRRNHARPLK